MTCKFSKECDGYKEDNYTCKDGGDYCGKFRQLEKKTFKKGKSFIK